MLLQRADHAGEAVAIVSHLLHAESQVGPVERCGDDLRARDAQHREDLLPRGRRRAARQGQGARLAQVVAEFAQLPVDRPKRVAPFHDAVRLVDGQEWDLDRRIAHEAGQRDEPFRSAVEKPSLPAQCQIEDGALVGR